MHDEHGPNARHPTHQHKGPGQERTRALARISSHLLPIPRVWHVGTFNPADKGRGSQEGAGISVSLHPQAWQRIAHLSGEVYCLTKPSAGFVDVRRCLRDRSIMRAVCRWAAEQGYVERRTIYRFTYYDDEQEDWLQPSFLAHRETREEYDSWKEALASPVSLHTFQGYAPTARMTRRALHDQPPLALVKDFALAFFVEDLLPEIDGLWWDDDYRPSVLSTPRGALFAHKLALWTVARVQHPPPTRLLRT
jgi:hypothetical protein